MEVATFGKILSHFSSIVPLSATGVRLRRFRRWWRLVARVGTLQSLVLQVGDLMCCWQQHSIKTFLLRRLNSWAGQNPTRGCSANWRRRLTSLFNNCVCRHSRRHTDMSLYVQCIVTSTLHTFIATIDYRQECVCCACMVVVLHIKVSLFESCRMTFIMTYTCRWISCMAHRISGLNPMDIYLWDHLWSLLYRS